MDESNQGRQSPRPLAMLVVGAVLSSVPLLISIGLQNRSQDKQGDKLRQLDVIHTYLQSCNQFNNDKRRLLEALNRSIIYGGDNQPGEQLAVEARTHSSEYRLQISIVNLTFGEHIEPTSPTSFSLPSFDGQTKERILETWQKALATFKSEIDREEQGCEEVSRRLLDTFTRQE